jgi:hypothetical protein
MKKLLGCFLCVMLLFCLSTPAAADIIFDVDLLDSYTNGQNLGNSGDPVEDAWVNALYGSPVDLAYEDSDGSDGWSIGQPGAIVLLKYANANSPNAPYGFDHWAIIDDDMNGMLDLLNVTNPFNYVGSGAVTEGLGATLDLGYQALSHVRSTVPEPTTMLLLGFGLVGLAGFGRKKFKK